MQVFEREQRENPEGGAERTDEGHGESGEWGAHTPEPGHPAPGEGAGMPERGAGRAKMDSTPPIGTEDQGEPERADEGEGS
jgi:hypothetical protein